MKFTPETRKTGQHSGGGVKLVPRLLDLCVEKKRKEVPLLFVGCSRHGKKPRLQFLPPLDIVFQKY